MSKRTEYPRPQFRRDEWQSLNGEWEFAFDDANEGVKRGFWRGNKQFSQKIVVPFSYQYKESGIGDKTQHDVVWYRRTFKTDMPAKRVILNFNAADYETDVWVNGIHVITHTGGFTPFSADITDCLNGGENVLVVRCFDSLETAVPRGKQSWKGEPFACFYVPNTGIWQSVWLDYVGKDYVRAYSLESDIDRRCVRGQLDTAYALADEAEISVSFRGKELQRLRVKLMRKRTRFTVDFSDCAFDFGDLLWTTDSPKLLDFDVTLLAGGEQVDAAHTRLGMRKIHIDEKGNVCLNNRPIFQKLILDQGYWVESGLTPPSAEALKKDIELAKAMGFNGARKHQKLEDPYFYYYAEELGFLTWCEMPSAYTFCAEEIASVTKEWQEIVAVAKNFTSVVAYVPLNESWGTREIATDLQQQEFARTLYHLTKSLDGGRLVSTNDGFENVNPTDFVSVHDYEIGKSEDFPIKYKPKEYDGLYPQSWRLFAEGNGYMGQPVLFTEFGGMALKAEQKDGDWGYNEGVKDAEEFYAHFEELLRGIALTEFQGYCYTQLTDVQQEINGLLRADHTPKFDVCRIRKIVDRY